MKKLKYEELNALKGIIREEKFTYLDLAKETGISISALNNKINGYSAFDLCEVVKLIEILEITPEDINKYFFPTIYQNTLKKYN